MTTTPWAFLDCPEQKDDGGSVQRPKTVDPGWDFNGRKLYRNAVLRILSAGTRTVEVNPPGRKFYVSKATRRRETDFWERVEREYADSPTYKILNKYVNPGNTTVVDIGVGVGPTLLHHGQRSRRSFGIEADPTAYAVAETNVELNRKMGLEWADRVTVDPGCVAAPGDAGDTVMSSGSISWEVRCVALPDLLRDRWGVRGPYEDVLVRVDVAPHECGLVPSFHDWLREERYLPKMHVVFHTEARKCSPEEYMGILKFLMLYDHVRVFGDTQEVHVHNETTVGDMIWALRDDFVVYQDHHGIASA